VDISTLRGRPVWINFMGSYCPECRDELPLMERIQAQLGEKVAILLVDVKEEEPVIQDFVTTLGVTLPVGLDRDGKAADQWRALVLPIHYWLDADGRVQAYLIGGAGPDVLLDGLRNVVPDASIRP
jgi:cytochrome c biogenesis protein CcmG, thiol:disulfide interchange protein DsbE